MMTFRGDNQPGLTHPTPDKTATILQTIFSDAFSWMKCFVFWLKFHCSLFPIVQLIIPQHWFRYGLASNRRHAIIWTNADPIHWRIYAALGGDELMIQSTCVCSAFKIGVISSYIWGNYIQTVSRMSVCHLGCVNWLHEAALTWIDLHNSVNKERTAKC